MRKFVAVVCALGATWLVLLGSSGFVAATPAMPATVKLGLARDNPFTRYLVVSQSDARVVVPTDEVHNQHHSGFRYGPNSAAAVTNIAASLADQFGSGDAWTAGAVSCQMVDAEASTNTATYHETDQTNSETGEGNAGEQTVNQAATEGPGSHGWTLVDESGTLQPNDFTPGSANGLAIAGSFTLAFTQSHAGGLPPTVTIESSFLNLTLAGGVLNATWTRPDGTDDSIQDMPFNEKVNGVQIIFGAPTARIGSRYFLSFNSILSTRNGGLMTPLNGDSDHRHMEWEWTFSVE